MKKLLVIFFLVIIQNNAKLLTSMSLDIDIVSLEKCNGDNYPVQVSNVAIEIDKGELIMSGTLSTTIDLDTPMKAVVEVERHQVGVWIKMPCVDQIGSCTYDDLCVQGVPANKSCPRQFIDNNVPCRCPIPKGTYTIWPSIKLPMNSYSRLSSIYTGKYWAKVFLLHKESNLACYEVYFNIRDKTQDDMKDILSGYNHIEPFVELVR